jgi:hypothetical protein
VLHRRGGREIFRQATLWCRSPVRLERELGVYPRTARLA